MKTKPHPTYTIVAICSHDLLPFVRQVDPICREPTIFLTSFSMFGRTRRQASKGFRVRSEDFGGTLVVSRNSFSDASIFTIQYKLISFVKLRRFVA